LFIEQLAQLFLERTVAGKVVGWHGMPEVVPVVRTAFRVLKWKPCSVRRRGGGNVKIGFIDFQGLVGRAENSSIVFRAFHETGISTAWMVAR
jgi:hypothetical protein